MTVIMFNTTVGFTETTKPSLKVENNPDEILYGGSTWNDGAFSFLPSSTNVYNFKNGPESLTIACNSEHFAFTLRCIQSAFTQNRVLWRGCIVPYKKNRVQKSIQSIIGFEFLNQNSSKTEVKKQRRLKRK